MTALDALLPLVAVLVGAGVTYWINVRQRHLTYVEDVYNAAISAVSAAENSVDYLASVGRPEYMSTEDFETLQRWAVMEGVKNWATKVAQANDALARVLPYEPDLESLMKFSPDAGHRGTGKPVIAVLRAGLARHQPRWTWTRPPTR